MENGLRRARTQPRGGRTDGKAPASGCRRPEYGDDGAYPVSPTEIRPPHIHFDVEGKANRLVSQMFFPGEPLNEKDELFLNLRSQSEKIAAVVIAQTLAPTKEIEKGAVLFGWDIVLING